MISITLELPSNHDLVQFGDTHEGSLMQYREGIEKCKDFILSEKDRYAVHMGDAVEAIMVDDNRYSEATRDSRPIKQCEAVVEDFKSLEGHLKVMLDGNHPRKLWRFGDLTKDLICKPLGIKYGTISCIVHVRDQYGLIYNMYLHHGFGTINSNAKDYEQRKANMKANLKMKLKYKFNNCLIMSCGHTHKLLIVRPTEELMLIAEDNGRVSQRYKSWEQSDEIDQDKRWYTNTGSFYRTFSDELDRNNEPIVSYPEMFGYDPVELGFLNIQCRDRKIVNIEKKVV